MEIYKIMLFTSSTFLLSFLVCSYPEGGVNSLQTLLVQLPLDTARCWWVAGHFAYTVTIIIISTAEQVMSQLNKENLIPKSQLVSCSCISLKFAVEAIKLLTDM